jgi:hypothetical protein
MTRPCESPEVNSLTRVGVLTDGSRSPVYAYFPRVPVRPVRICRLHSVKDVYFVPNGCGKVRTGTIREQ